MIIILNSLGRIIFSAYVLCSLSSCILSDLRNDEVIRNFDSEKGKEILFSAYIAHNASWWDSVEVYQLNLKDQFVGIQGKFGSPYPKGSADLLARFMPNSYNVSVRFLSGKLLDEQWGIQSWHTYTINREGEIIFKKDKNIEFWLPTYQYFIEFPSRILNADIISYAGSKMENESDYELVFVSWKKAEPQRDIDQYLVYVNKETNLIEIVEFTIRDFYGFIKGRIDYQSYSSEIGGLLVPEHMVVKNAIGNGTLHKMELDNFEVNTFPVEFLLPDADLPFLGVDKEF